MTPSAPPHAPVRLKVPLVGRVLGWAVAAGFVGAALVGVVVVLLDFRESGFWGLGVAVAFGCWGVLMWRLVTVRMDLIDGQLAIRNVLQSYRLDLGDVQRVDLAPAFGGSNAVACLNDGSQVEISVIHKSNVALIFGSQSKADDTVRNLNMYLASARGGAASP